jgi:hypothetical protein
MIPIGRRVEIRPAYNSETDERDIWDDVAGIEGRIVDHHRSGNGEHLVEYRALDGLIERDWIAGTRLRVLGGET